jgi:nucleoside-diphosphate-sugar epimerase
MQTTILRLANVIGPGENKRRIVSRAFHCALTGETLTINGITYRDFVDVRDVARAFVLALKQERPFDCSEIGSGVAENIDAVVALCQEISGRPIDWIRGESMEREPFETVAENVNLPGWTAEIPLEQTLKDIWNTIEPPPGWTKESLEGLTW